LLEGRSKCSICNNENDHCFDLAFTITDKFSEDEKEGNRVSFEVEMGPKGASAVNVKKA
jgi:cold shock CspA family protein